jgi:dihydrofolate reductase
MSRVEIHGYAIVSDDDRIADEAGRTPDALRNDADWTYFQAELNRSDVTVLGRLGHEANPNPRGRVRMILSSSSPGIERRPDGWWWNPQVVAWEQAIHHVLPYGGRVAVPGGRQVFDLFLDIGYDAFHLTRAEGAVVPRGVPVFSACDSGKSAEAVLSQAGLRSGSKRILDPSGPVSLVVWRP